MAGVRGLLQLMLQVRVHAKLFVKLVRKRLCLGLALQRALPAPRHNNKRRVHHQTEKQQGHRDKQQGKLALLVACFHEQKEHPPHEKDLEDGHSRED